jgi:hypothetical protein
MGYFSNGTEGDYYQEAHCSKCVNWMQRDGESIEGCAVWDLHILYAYGLCNSKSKGKKMLDHLIPRNKKTGFNERCKMFFKKSD